MHVQWVTKKSIFPLHCYGFSLAVSLNTGNCQQEAITPSSGVSEEGMSEIQNPGKGNTPVKGRLWSDTKHIFIITDQAVQYAQGIKTSSVSYRRGRRGDMHHEALLNCSLGLWKPEAGASHHFSCHNAILLLSAVCTLHMHYWYPLNTWHNS